MGMTLIASVLGSTNLVADIPGYGELIEAGEMDLDVLVSDHFRLDEINEAMAKLHHGEVLKPIVDICEAA